MLAYPCLTGFCLLERAAFAEVVDCCPLDAQPTNDHPLPCDGVGCCPSKFAVYANPQTAFADDMAPLGDPISLDLSFIAILLSDNDAIPSEWPPPEISVSWQFTSRAALPPRAPSLVS